VPARNAAQAARRSAEGEAPLGSGELLAPRGLPALISDLELRASLQLAYHRRFPMIRSPCCGAEMCFACKSHGWHDQSACQQLRMDLAGQQAQFCPQCGVPTERNGGCQHMACVCGADWTWMSLSSALRTGDMKLITERLEIEGVGSWGHPDDAYTDETLLAAVVGMSNANVQLVRLVLDRGGDPHEEGILELAVARACLRGVVLDRKEVEMREDVALLLVSRGAALRVSRRYRRRCPARLAEVLDARKAWLSDRDVAENHEDVQQKLDREFARHASHLREASKHIRKKEKQVRIRSLRLYERPNRRGGRHKSGESKLDVISVPVHQVVC